MKLEEAKAIAQKYVDILKPYCLRIEIAGSIRRGKPEVKDIEIVVIPDYFRFEVFCQKVNKWKKVKGEPTGKYTQRILPEGIKLDLFIANERNWGLIYAIRTGSADFSHKILACGWVRVGFKSEGGILKRGGKEYEVREEKDLFSLIGIPFVEPRLRI